jgi:hypothetical protein
LDIDAIERTARAIERIEAVAGGKPLCLTMAFWRLSNGAGIWRPNRPAKFNISFAQQ